MKHGHGIIDQSGKTTTVGFSKRRVSWTNRIHYCPRYHILLCLLSTETIWKGLKLALDPFSQNSFSIHFIPSGNIHNIQPFWYILTTSIWSIWSYPWWNIIEWLYELTKCRTEICGKKEIEWQWFLSKYEIFN